MKLLISILKKYIKDNPIKSITSLIIMSGVTFGSISIALYSISIGYIPIIDEWNFLTIIGFITALFISLSIATLTAFFAGSFLHFNLFRNLTKSKKQKLILIITWLVSAFINFSIYKVAHYNIHVYFKVTLLLLSIAAILFMFTAILFSLSQNKYMVKIARHILYLCLTTLVPNLLVYNYIYSIIPKHTNAFSTVNIFLTFLATSILFSSLSSLPTRIIQEYRTQLIQNLFLFIIGIVLFFVGLQYCRPLGRWVISGSFLKAAHKDERTYLNIYNEKTINHLNYILNEKLNSHSKFITLCHYNILAQTNHSFFISILDSSGKTVKMHINKSNGQAEQIFSSNKTWPHCSNTEHKLSNKIITHKILNSSKATGAPQHNKNN